MEDQALHIVGEVDEHDLGLGTLDADGSDKQAHVRLFLSEDILSLGDYGVWLEGDFDQATALAKPYLDDAMVIVEHDQPKLMKENDLFSGI